MDVYVTNMRSHVNFRIIGTGAGCLLALSYSRNDTGRRCLVDNLLEQEQALLSYFP
jgi:hypothetical protein